MKGNGEPTGNCVLFVCNKAYLRRMLDTLYQVRRFGRYRGDVVVVVGDDLKDQLQSLSSHPLRLIPQYFPDLNLDQLKSRISGVAVSDGREYTKVFQWHKMYCFHPFLRKWKRVLYLDSGMHVYHSLAPFFALETEGKLVAHSDAFPEFSQTLAGQFNMALFPELEKEMRSRFDLKVDYFQSTFLLYETSLIRDGDFDSLLKLANTYYNSRTNEQAIMNLLFTCERRAWLPLATARQGKWFLYDFFEREGRRSMEYIMLKYPRSKDNLRLRSLRSVFSRESACE